MTHPNKPDDLPPAPPAPQPLPDEYIGTAHMDEAGTIELRLRAREGSTVGTGTFTYKKEHPQYAEILTHLGGLKPGEHKPVRPWPDRSP